MGVYGSNPLKTSHLQIHFDSYSWGPSQSTINPRTTWHGGGLLRLRHLIHNTNKTTATVLAHHSRPQLKNLFAVLAILVAITTSAVAALNSQEQTIANYIINAPGQQRAFVEIDPILSQVARARAL